MRSLRLARNHSSSEHEMLVYEGWILYDTGHREEALSRAEKSILLQRSFEAFFLKAYILADTNSEGSFKMSFRWSSERTSEYYLCSDPYHFIHVSHDVLF